MEHTYLTLAEAAEKYGVTARTLRRRIADGDLPAVRVGPRQIRVLASDLETLAVPVPVKARRVKA